MNMMKKGLLLLGCILILAVGWLAAASSQSDEEKQAALIESAESYLADEIYIKAVPLLEEAVSYNTGKRMAAEELLKKAYTKLFEKVGYRRKYTSLLDTQMSRKDAPPEVFLEAAKYYLSCSKEESAFEVLCAGIEKTGDQGLTDFYEENRYVYTMARDAYENVTEFQDGLIQVERDGLWGAALPDGSLKTDCEYEFLSSSYQGQMIAVKDGVLSGIDKDGFRLALYKGEPVHEITNYNEDRLAVHLQNGWVLATGLLDTGTALLEEIGTYSDGGAAAKLNGKWGVVGRNGKDWLVEPIYDGIVCDGQGRCYYDGTVFVRLGTDVILLVDGQPVGERFEDARPFAGGWAAVKKDGRWGFIDREGALQIEYQFEDAKSFSMHLAPVCSGGMWGYAGLSGSIVIEPVFQDAKAFVNGTAPVKTEKGWQFITLLEYKTGIPGI